jgi:hypothetical protein
MSSSAQADAGDENVTAGAGSSVDQHVTGAEETGTFTTDEAPTADTPAHGSSNEIFNKAGGNHPDATGGDA